MLTSVPPSLVPVLKEKLANQVFDSGTAFSLCIDEGSPQGHRVSLLTNHALAKESDIFLCDHLLTFAGDAPGGDGGNDEDPEAAALHLLQHGGEGLKARIHALLEMDEEEAETAAAENIVQRMWPLVGAYSLPDKQHPEQSRKFFFVMDEVGSRFCEVFPRRSLRLEEEEEGNNNDEATSKRGAGFHCALVFHPTTGEAFTAFWPRREVEEGEIATCDNLPHGQAARLARLQMLERFASKDYKEEEEDEEEEEEEEDQDIQHTLHHLREFLLTNNYNVESINTLLGLKEACEQLLPVWDISERRLREAFVKQMQSQSSSSPLLVLLVKFFLMGMAVPHSELLSGVKDRALVWGLEKLGLLFVEGNDDDESYTHASIKSLVQLTPVPVSAAGEKPETCTTPAAAIVATDFAQVGSGSGGFDPVMYVGPDSLGLVAAVPPPPPPSPSPSPSPSQSRARRRILDLCSGCGLQGIVAALASSSSPLEEVTMVELNPRAARFARFNIVINGLDPSTVKVLESDVRALLPTHKSTDTTHKPPTKATESPSPSPSSLLSPAYDLILCNPPYIANPGKQARNLHGYGDGGATGEEVTEAVVELASQLLQNQNENEGGGERGWLYLVGNLVNVDSLPLRVEKWWSTGSSAAAGAHTHTHTASSLPQVKVYHGKKWSTGEYAAIIHNHRLEETTEALTKDPVVRKYKEALDATGVTDVSNGFLFLKVLPDKQKQGKKEEGPMSVSLSVSGAASPSAPAPAAAAVVVPLHEQLWQVLAMCRDPEAKEAREKMREGWI